MTADTYVCRRGHVASGRTPSTGRRYCQTCATENQRRRRVAVAAGEAFSGKASTAERFTRLVEASPDGCWHWKGNVTSGGYGRFRDENGRNVSAHRVSYQLHVGPIAEGLQLDHLCRVRHCVNPAHLEPVTPRENTMRGQTVTAANAAKDHCKRGHVLPEPVNGRRDCKECKRIRGVERRSNPERRERDRLYQQRWYQARKESAA